MSLLLVPCLLRGPKGCGWEGSCVSPHLSRHKKRAAACCVHLQKPGLAAPLCFSLCQMPPSIRPCPLQYLSDLVTAARPLWRKEGRRAAGAPHPPTLLLRSLEAVTLLAEAWRNTSSMLCRRRSPWSPPSIQQHCCGPSSFHLSQWKLLLLKQAGLVTERRPRAVFGLQWGCIALRVAVLGGSSAQM